MEREVREFKCLQCGECCNDFLSDKSKDKKTGEFDSPITVYLNRAYLSLYDWEINDFSEELKKIKSERRIVPSVVSFDLKSNRTIVHMYTLDGQNCPFFLNNKCEIYNKRPLICKQFPCLQDLSGLIFGKPIGLNRNTLCKFEREDKFPYNLGITNLPISEFIRILKKRYGDSLYYNLAGHNFAMSTILFLNQLNSEGKINLAKKGYDIKYLLKRIGNSKHIGISKFFEEITGKSVDSIYNIEFTKAFFEKLLSETSQ